jgi:integrase/recombinase XerD
MKNMPKIAIILEKRFTKNDDNFPLKLRLTFGRLSRYYPCEIKLTEAEYVAQRDCELNRANKLIGLKEFNRLFEIKNKLNQKLQEAELKIAKLKPFSFEAFEANYTPQANKNDEMFVAIREKIQELENESRLGTAVTYKSTLFSLKSFHQKSRLPIGLVTPHFLKKYEKWMLENGKSVTTIGYYLRNLRAIFNEMVSLNKSIQVEYPFGNKKYVIPTKKNFKKALTNEDLKKIFNYNPEPVESKYFHYWLFMYIGNGMNPYDMFNLKFKNIDGDQITFVRQKTANTNRTETKIQVNYHPKAREIVSLFGNKEVKDSHIFPLFTNEVTAIEKKKVLHGMVKNINKYMRRIGQKLEIDKDITTYVARHSFVTKLITGGASITEVKDLVGHTSIATTEKYVASIEDDRIKQLSNTLLDF